jgi:hypothetical protein
VSALEDRLAAEMRAESELIGPESLPELSLPGLSLPGLGPSGRRGRRAGRRWPAWLTPLAAAAAVLAVVAGTLTAVRMLSGPSAPQPATPAPSRLPAYYAVTISGNVVSYTSGGTQYSSSVLGRSIQIRATATGKLVATVRPPAPYNDFTVLTGTPDGQTFVFGAERYWGFRGVQSPLTGALDPSAPLRFVQLHVTPDGQARWSALSLPVSILPGQQPSIALSPDGTRLAVAYGGGGPAAILRVITLATGQTRDWQWPHASWTPLIQGQGAWTADGRTLMLQQWNVVRGATSQPPAGHTAANTTTIWLVDTAAPGGVTPPGPPLTLHAPAGLSAPGPPFITPDGSELVATTGTGARSLLPGSTARGEFAVYSARTGALVRTLAPWTWSQTRPAAGNRFPAPAVAWSDPSGSELLVLLPRDGLNRLAVLTGGQVVLTGGGLLPGSPGAHASLQNALQGASAVPPHMTW